MRRKDRERDAEFAYSVIDKCEYAVLSMIDPDGAPYCVPLTIVRDGGEIYFHCAQEGYKTECLRKNDKVCLACVGDTRRPPDQFTTEYESAIVRGRAAEVTQEEEKTHALYLLCRRHTPANMGQFDKAITASLHRTAVWKIEISEITGKSKPVHREE